MRAILDSSLALVTQPQVSRTKQKLTLDDKVKLLQRTLGKLAPCGTGFGLDSEVYLLNQDTAPVVVKVYHHLEDIVEDQSFLYHKTPTVFEILQHYNSDTLLAKSFAESMPNPCDSSIDIDDQKYRLQFQILPQGTVDICRGRIVYSIGQPHIQGQNFCDMQRNSGPGIINVSSSGYYPIAITKKKLDEVQVYLTRFSKEINRQLGTKFWLSAGNAIPRIDTENKILHIVVTDLANDLFTQYVKNQYREYF